MTALYCSRFNVPLDKTVSEDSHDQLILVPISVFTVFCKMYVCSRKSLFNSYIDDQFCILTREWYKLINLRKQEIEKKNFKEK